MISRIPTFLFFLSLLPTQPISAAEKYALLIGVTEYQKAQLNRAPLKFPEADASAVGNLLKRNGYTVRLLTGKDATQAAIERELSRLEPRGSQDGVVFIGLFGHGVQYGVDAWFCPYDTQLRRGTAQGQTATSGQLLEPDPDSMTSMKRLLQALNMTGASNRVLMADCCRNDPSTTRSALIGRAFGDNMRLINLEPGTAIIFSCSNNQQAYEHPSWGHGALTRAFLDYCDELASEDTVDSTVSTMVAPLSRTVQDLVKKIDASKVQRINPILNGVVDLQIVGRGESPPSSTPGSSMHNSVIQEKLKEPDPVAGPVNIANADLGKVKLMKPWMPVLQARMATPETLPNGWDSDGLVSQMAHLGVVLIGRQGSGTIERAPAILSTRNFSIDGDFDLTATVFAPDGGDFLFQFSDNPNVQPTISLRCGKVATGTTRSWWFRAGGSSGPKVSLNKPQQTIVISRRGNALRCSIEGKAAGAFRTDMDRSFDQMKIGIFAGREPAGLVSLNLVPR